MRHALLLLLLALPACISGSARPPFQPMPEARMGEIALDPIEVTRKFAESLEAKGYTLDVIAPRDGYFATTWFDTLGLAETGRRIGPRTARIRGWAVPSRFGWSAVTVEAVYVAAVDPSRPERELERSVPWDHPARRRVREVMEELGILTNVSETGGAVVVRPPVMDPGRLPQPGDTSVVIRPQRDSLRGVADAPDTVAVTDSAAPPPAAEVPPPVEARAPAEVAPAPAQVAPAQQAPEEAVPEGYAVQVAAARDAGEAQAVAARLRRMGYRPQLVREGGFLKVRTEVWPDRTDANIALEGLRRSFPDAFVVRQ